MKKRPKYLVFTKRYGLFCDDRKRKAGFGWDEDHWMYVEYHSHIPPDYRKICLLYVLLLTGTMGPYDN